LAGDGRAIDGWFYICPSLDDLHSNIGDVGTDGTSEIFKATKRFCLKDMKGVNVDRVVGG